jgi:hypothetical protein
LILDNPQHQLFSQAMYLQDLITERLRTHYKFPAGFNRLSMPLLGNPEGLRKLGNPDAERMCSDAMATQEDVLNLEFALLDSNSRLLLTIVHILSLEVKQSASLEHMASETAKILAYELVDLFNFVTDLCKFAHLIGVEVSGNEEILKSPSDLLPIVHQLTAAPTRIRGGSIKSQKLRINSVVSAALQFHKSCCSMTNCFGIVQIGMSSKSKCSIGPVALTAYKEMQNYASHLKFVTASTKAFSMLPPSSLAKNPEAHHEDVGRLIDFLKKC